MTMPLSHPTLNLINAAPVTDGFPSRRRMTSTTSDNGLQEGVLEEALRQVPRLGWTRAALESAAEKLQLSQAVVGSFPRAAGNLIEYFNGKCNHELENLFRESCDTMAAMTAQERIAHGLRQRLAMVQPYIGE